MTPLKLFKSYFLKIGIILFFIFITACTLKSKTELYLERGLDLLDNTIAIDTSLSNKYGIKKIGVIRDRLNNTRVLVIMLDTESLKKGNIGNNLRITVYKKINMNKYKTETWEIDSTIIQAKKFKYLVQELHTNIEEKVDTLKLYYFNKFQQKAIGDTLILNNLYLNND